MKNANMISLKKNSIKKKHSLLYYKRKYFFYFFIILFFLYTINFLYHTTKSLPDGISHRGDIYEINESEIDFVYDLTYKNNEGDIITQHQIYDEIFKNIDEANSFILIDLFLIDRNDDSEIYRQLSKELTNHLISKKQSNPDIEIYFMSDSYNTFYGSFENENFVELNQNGIEVKFTDHKILRDSNPIYSALWRTLFSYFDIPNKPCENSLINYKGKKVCIRSIFYALNFKANHRKIIVSDKIENGNLKIISVLTSANPSDYGSRHSNVGIILKEDASKRGVYSDIIFSESKIAEKSKVEFLEKKFVGEKIEITKIDKDKTYAQFLSENEIKKDFILEVKKLSEGDSIEIAQFLLTDKDIIQELIYASDRGVDIKIVLDPSKQLFGRDTKGIPNIAAAGDLFSKTRASKIPIEIRFYNTNHEEYHSKLMVIKKKDGRKIIYVGSANLTKRNLNDLNLEANIKILTPADSRISNEVNDYFNLIWYNNDALYTSDYNSKPKITKFNYVKFRIKETLGLCAW